MNLMTLDPDTKHIGWAVSLPGQAVPLSGVLKLPETPAKGTKVRGSELYYLRPARDWLKAKIEKHEVSHLCAEAPFVGPNAQTAIKLSVLSGMIVLLCHDLGVEYSRAEPSSWRSDTHGRTQAPKHIKGTGPRRRWLKRQAIEWCCDRGWPVRNPDQAEALCINAYKRGLLDPSQNWRNLPMGAVA